MERRDWSDSFVYVTRCYVIIEFLGKHLLLTHRQAQNNAATFLLLSTLLTEINYT